MWTREVATMGDEPRLGVDQPSRADGDICNCVRSVGGGSLLSTSVFLFVRSKQGMEFVFSGLPLSMGYNAGRFRALRRTNSSKPSGTHATRSHGVSDGVAGGSDMVCHDVHYVGPVAFAWNAETGKTNKSNLSIAGVC